MRVFFIFIFTLFVTLAIGVPSAAANDKAMPIPIEYFGLHIHRADQGTVWPIVPFGSWRLWDAYVAWPNLQPERDKWDFTRLDKYVIMAEANKVELVLPLGLSPAWASSRPDEKSAYRPGNASEPRDFEDWRNYVRTVAERYKGKIRYYEIWNEPNSRNFYTGNIETLVELTCEANSIIKSIDATAKLISPAVTGEGRNVTYLDEFLSKGGKDCIDVVAYHFYVVTKPPEAMAPLIREVRAAMKKNGVENKPLWNTETGWWFANSDGTKEGDGVSPSWRRIGSEESEAYVARAFIVGATEGLGRFFWYAWDNKSLGLIEPTAKTLKPAANGYARAEEWLVHGRLSKCQEGDTLWLCELSSQAHPQAWIVWDPSGKGVWNPPVTQTQLRVTDLQGRKTFLQMGSGKAVEVTDLPVLVEPIQ